jgi:hypothetical protein
LFIIVSGPVISAPVPFEAGSKWVICQGYNTREIDHVNSGNPEGRNNGLYALDFVVDLNGLGGTYGCLDVKETIGKKIIAPAAGKVKIQNWGVSSGICLRLDQSYEGRIKSIKFFHLSPNGNFIGANFDKSVVAGQVLGNLEPKNANNPVPHLHLAAFTNDGCDGAANTTPFGSFFDNINLDAEFSGGEPALYQHRKQKVVAPLVPISNLSSMGSVIDPQLGGDCKTGTPGCSYDVVRMQPAAVSSSSAFQVLSQAGLCQTVEISQGELRTLTGLYISVKQFDEEYPGIKGNTLSTIYKANSLPVRVQLPPNKFMVVKVTTPEPLTAGKPVDITAACVKGSFQQAPPGNQLINLANPTDGNAQIVMRDLLDDGSNWAGAASLIGYSGNVSTAASRNGFTKDKDDVVNVSTRKSTITLQAWRSHTTCLKVKLENARGQAGALVDLKYKIWNSKDWVEKKSQTLPLTVDLFGDGFWILQATVSDPSITKRILAQCLK